MTSTLTQELFGSGAATGEDAVCRAVDEAVAGLGRRPPGLVLVFPSGDLDSDRSARAMVAAAPGATVVGMTGNGEISPDGPLLDGCSALALDTSVQAGVGVVERASLDLRAAGRLAAERAFAEVPEVAEADRHAGHTLLLLFLDPDSGDYAEAVAGAYEVAGPHVPMAGGGAGGRAPTTFAGGEARQDAAVAVAVVSPRPLAVGLDHGCRPLGTPAIVTRSAGSCVLALDGRPAEAVYLEKMGRGDEDLSELEFQLVVATHPLGQPELGGDLRLRHVRGRAHGGGLELATHIPENAAVEVTVESPDSIVESGCRAVREALAPLERPRGVVVFDCAGRKRAVGASLGRSVAGMLSCLPGPAALAGAYTHGEIGRTRGAKGDRNHAIVVVAFG